MSTTNYTNDPEAAHGKRDESSGVKDQAQQAAGSATDEGKRVAGVAQKEIKNVTAEAQNQLRGILEQATSQVDEQSREQQGRLAETVRTFGDDLHGMTSQGSGGLAAQLVRQIADQARGLASHLENREPSELLEDVRSFARRRPGTFLLGALTAGVVVGRVAGGAKAGQDDPSADGDASVSGGTTSKPRAGLMAESRATPKGDGLADSHPHTDLGAKGVEISEAGVPSSSRGPA
ncbi:MAG: hypothetical protein JWR85_2327 [Marmoricola sp.]|nr:hypothetical protein [Marmoricola sp.]